MKTLTHAETFTYDSLNIHIKKSWVFSIFLLFCYLYKLIFVHYILLDLITCFVLFVIIFSLMSLLRDTEEYFIHDNIPKIGFLKMTLYDFGLIFCLGVLSFYLFFYVGVYGLYVVFRDLSGWGLVFGIIKKIIIIYFSYQFVVSVDKIQTIKLAFEKGSCKRK